MPALTHGSPSVAIPKAPHVSKNDVPERACPKAAVHLPRLALLRHPHRLVTPRPVPAASTKNINRRHHGT
jgi:hypothetical protein